MSGPLDLAEVDAVLEHFPERREFAELVDDVDHFLGELERRSFLTGVDEQSSTATLLLGRDDFAAFGRENTNRGGVSCQGADPFPAEPIIETKGEKPVEDHEPPRRGRPPKHQVTPVE